MTEKISNPPTMIGKVVSNKMDKTVTVAVERKVKHPLYGKYLRRTTKVFAHDEQNQYREGDIVRIQEVRPLSKKKSWELVKIMEQTEVAD